MKYIILIFILIIMATACQPSKTDQTHTSPTLTLKWQTDSLLTTCESVIYDKEHDVLYVANINGTPDVKDGNGFISKVAMDGTITAAHWISNLDAPKGMGLFNRKLYAADIDRIHEIDVVSGKVIQTYAVPGAKFLNDITTDAAGRVFSSDSNTGDIFMLQNGKISKWFSGVDGPNGLLAEGNHMWVLAWNTKTMNSIDTASRQMVMKADSLEFPDGIEAVGNGDYLVSSWKGMVQYVDTNGKSQVILDTRADSLSAADIAYIPEKKLLLVPTFYKNRVMAYELKQ
jgi:hypothetical protein